MADGRLQNLLTPLVLRRGKAGRSAANTLARLPEPHLVLAWFCSFFGFPIWLHGVMGIADYAVLLCSHVMCLPLLSRSVTPQTITWLAGPIYGIIVGLQVLDLCFDLLILRTRSGPPDVALEAGKLAFQYYNLVLNAMHVNAVLMCVILVASLGSLVGFSRSSSEVRRTWLMMGVCMVIGTGGYLVCVVSRYLKIRVAKEFSMDMFEGWEVVFAARINLFVCVMVSLPLLFKIAKHSDTVHKEF